MNYKAKSNFELKNVAGDFVLIPRGATSVDYSSLIVFNEAGVFLWQQMTDYSSAEELSQKLVEKYGIDNATALEDVNKYIKKMLASELIEAK